MLNKVAQYAKNVAKSVSYVAADVAGEMFENPKSFVEENSETLKGAYNSIRDYRTTFKRVKDRIIRSQVFVAANVGINSLVEDLKTGDWYAKDREERLTEKFGGMGIGESWDMDSDDFDWNKDSMDISDGDKVIATAIKKNSKLSSAKQAEVAAQIGKAQIDASRENTTLLYIQNEKMMNKVNNGFERVASILTQTANTTAKNQQETWRKTAEFYSKIDKNTSTIVAQLDELLKMQRNLYADTREEQKRKNNKKGISDIINANGQINLKEYGGQIKKNVGSFLTNELGIDLGGMLNMFEGGNTLAMLAANPMRDVVKGVVNKSMSKEFKNQASNLNELLGSMAYGFIGQMNNAKVNGKGFGKVLGHLLGINMDREDGIDTSKYHKGAISFDGVTKKSIVEVIPHYLRKIAAATAGGDEEIFDYNTGRWTTLRNQHEIMKTANEKKAIAAMGDFMSYLKEGVGGRLDNMHMDKNQADEFVKGLEQFMNVFYNNPDFNILVNPYEYGINETVADFIKKSFDRNKKYAFSYKDLKTKKGGIVKRVNGLDRSKGNGTGMYNDREDPTTVLMNTIKNVFESHTNNKRKREDEIANDLSLEYLFASEGISTGKGSKYLENFQNVHGDFVKKDMKDHPISKAIAMATDQYGYTIFDYLKNIKIDLSAIRSSGLLGLIGSVGGFENSGSPVTMTSDSIMSFEKASKDYSWEYWKNAYNENKRKDEENYERARAQQEKDWEENAKNFGTNKFNHKMRKYKRANSYDEDAGKKTLESILNDYMDQYKENYEHAVAEEKKSEEEKDLLHQLEYWGMIEPDKRQELSKIQYDKEKTLKEQLDKLQGGASKMVLLNSYVKGIAEKPWQYATDAMVSMEAHIHDIFFGSVFKSKNKDGEEEEVKGLFGLMQQSFKDGFDDVVTTISNKFKEIVDDPNSIYNQFKKKVVEPFVNPVLEGIFGKLDEDGVRRGGVAGEFWKKNFDAARQLIKDDKDKIKKEEEKKNDETDNASNPEPEKFDMDKIENTIIERAFKSDAYQRKAKEMRHYKLRQLRNERYNEVESIIDRISLGTYDFDNTESEGRKALIDKALKSKQEGTFDESAKQKLKEELLAEIEKGSSDKVDTEVSESIKNQLKSKLNVDVIFKNKTGLEIFNGYGSGNDKSAFKDKNKMYNKTNAEKIVKAVEKAAGTKYSDEEKNQLGVKYYLKCLEKNLGYSEAMSITNINTYLREQIDYSNVSDELNKLIRKKDEGKEEITGDENTKIESFFDTYLTSDSRKQESIDILKETERKGRERHKKEKAEKKKFTMIEKFLKVLDEKFVAPEYREDLREFVDKAKYYDDEVVIKSLNITRDELRANRDAAYEAVIRRFIKGDLPQQITLLKRSFKYGEIKNDDAVNYGTNNRDYNNTNSDKKKSETMTVIRDEKEVNELFEAARHDRLEKASKVLSRTKESFRQDQIKAQQANTNILEKLFPSVGKIADLMEQIAKALSNPIAPNNHTNSGIILPSRNITIPNSTDNNIATTAFGGISYRSGPSVYSAGEKVIRGGQVHTIKKMGLYDMKPGDVIINPASPAKAKQQYKAEQKYKEQIMSNAEAAEGTLQINNKVADWINDPNLGGVAADYVAKAGIGGVIGTLLGVPMLGAGLGIMTGVAKRSESFSDALFGTELADGTRKDNGLFSKEIQEAFPWMRRGGMIGAIALPLLTGMGPLAGLAIGAAAGFAKKSELLEDTLFADVDKEKVKAALPKMGLGALAGIMLAPTGLGWIPAALLGSAAGFASTTDKFKEIIFGKDVLDKDGNPTGDKYGGMIGAIKNAMDPLKNFGKDIIGSVFDVVFGKEGIDDDGNVKRLGGLLGDVKNWVIQPLIDSVAPLTQSIRNTFRDIGDFAKDKVGAWLERTFGEDIFSKITDTMGKIGGGLIKGAGFLTKIPLGIASLPFQGLKAATSHIRRNQIRAGKADDMTAEERLARRDTLGFKIGSALFHGGDEYKKHDETIANMSKKEGSLDKFKNAAAIASVLAGDSGKKDYFRQKSEDIKTEFMNLAMNYLRKADVSRIMSSVNEGNYNRARKFIMKVKDKDRKPLTPQAREELLKLLNKLETDIGENQKKQDILKNTSKDKLKQQLIDSGFGDFDLDNKKELRKLKRNLQSEIKDKESRGETSEATTEDIPQIIDKIYEEEKHRGEQIDNLSGQLGEMTDLFKKYLEHDNASSRADEIQKDAEKEGKSISRLDALKQAENERRKVEKAFGESEDISKIRARLKEENPEADEVQLDEMAQQESDRQKIESGQERINSAREKDNFGSTKRHNKFVRNAARLGKTALMKAKLTAPAVLGIKTAMNPIFAAPALGINALMKSGPAKKLSRKIDNKLDDLIHGTVKAEDRKSYAEKLWKKVKKIDLRKTWKSLEVLYDPATKEYFREYNGKRFSNNAEGYNELRNYLRKNEIWVDDEEDKQRYFERLREKGLITGEESDAPTITYDRYRTDEDNDDNQIVTNATADEGTVPIPQEGIKTVIGSKLKKNKEYFSGKKNSEEGSKAVLDSRKANPLVKIENTLVKVAEVLGKLNPLKPKEEKKKTFMQKVLGFLGKAAIMAPFAAGLYKVFVKPLFKKHIIPWLRDKVKPVLIGTKRKDGTMEGGLLSPLVNVVNPFIKRVGNWFLNKGEYSAPEKGSSGLVLTIVDTVKTVKDAIIRGLPKAIESAAYIWTEGAKDLGKVLWNVGSAVIKAFPSLVSGFIEGVKDALKHKGKADKKVGKMDLNTVSKLNDSLASDGLIDGSTSGGGSKSSGSGQYGINNPFTGKKVYFDLNLSPTNPKISSSSNYEAISSINQAYSQLGMLSGNSGGSDLTAEEREKAKTSYSDEQVVGSGRFDSSGQEIYYAKDDVEQSTPLVKGADGNFYNNDSLTESTIDPDIANTEAFRYAQEHKINPVEAAKAGGHQDLSTGNKVAQSFIRNAMGATVYGKGGRLAGKGVKLIGGAGKGIGKGISKLPGLIPKGLGGSVQAVGSTVKGGGSVLETIFAKGGIKNGIKSLPGKANNKIVNAVSKSFWNLNFCR